MDLVVVMYYGMPIFCTVFCLNLVGIIKKAVAKEDTIRNTIWFTLSFIAIMWGIIYLIILSS